MSNLYLRVLSLIVLTSSTSLDWLLVSLFKGYVGNLLRCELFKEPIVSLDCLHLILFVGILHQGYTLDYSGQSDMKKVANVPIILAFDTVPDSGLVQGGTKLITVFFLSLR